MFVSFLNNPDQLNPYLDTSNPTITAVAGITITTATTANKVTEMLEALCPVPSSNWSFTE